jgi:hypothetical protein
MHQWLMDDAHLRALGLPETTHRHASGAPASSPHISRRHFIGGAAGAAGAVVGMGVLAPVSGLAKKPFDATPKVTTHTVTLNGETFHLNFFGPTTDPTVITDFNGFAGVADVQGTGTATYPDGHTETLLTDTDMRFMKGVYVGQDGAVHKGDFGFV